jgi:signal transduction histidine kinase
MCPLQGAAMPFAGSSRRSPRLTAAAVSLVYLAVGWAWIGFSDQIGTILFSPGPALARFQTSKGGAFVLATALFLFFLLDRRYNRYSTRAPSRFAVPLGIALAGLVLVTAMPMLLLLGYNIVRDSGSRVAEAQRLVTSTAQATAADVVAFLGERQKMAAMLGHQPAVEGADVAGCTRLLQTVASMNEHLRAIAVFDATQQRVCGVGALELLQHVPPAWLAQGDTPLLSHPYRLAPDAAWHFAITYPLRTRNGGSRDTVQLVMAAAALEEFVHNELPEGAATTLIDTDGFVLARSPSGDWVGTQVPDSDTLRQLKKGRTTMVARGSDGVERFYAVHRADPLGIYAVAGVAVDQIYGPVRLAALRYAAVALLVVLFAALAIARILRGINRPMQALAHAAEQVAVGRFDARAPEAGPLEVRRVASQFNSMLDRLPALERELRESEERSRTLLDKLSRNIPGMLFQFRVSPEGEATVPFASHGIYTMFETSPEEARLRVGAIQDRIHPDDAAAVAAATQDSLRTLGNFCIEYRVILPRRGVRCYLTYSQPEKHQDGSVMWYGCTVDVTELKLAQQQLQTLNQELESRVEARTVELAAANAALESFSYSVAHDLRAPLAAISGFSSALASSNPERVQHFTERIVANAAKMEEMIAGLLALAGVGRQELQERPVDLAQLVRGLVAEIPVPAGLTVDIGELPVVVADSATLRQAWFNLLDNAVKFSSRREAGRVTVRCETSGDELVFSVADNGAGFDPAQAAGLFGVFKRLHAEHEFKGTGLGLAIVRRVVERHGGRVWAHARVDGGATFCFTLPATRRAG